MHNKLQDTLVWTGQTSLGAARLTGYGQNNHGLEEDEFGTNKRNFCFR